MVEHHSFEMVDDSTAMKSHTYMMPNDDIEVTRKPGCNINKYFAKYMRVRNLGVRLFLAEAFGTFLMLVFGLGTVIQYNLDENLAKSPISIHIGFGFAVTLAIIITGKVSGAHMNPAVSFAMLITSRLSLFHFVIYTIAQFVGAFLGAAFTFVIYADALQHTADLDIFPLFSTYPNKGVGPLGCFVDQVAGTALLIIFIMAISDAKNEKLSHECKSILVGFLIMVLGLGYAHNCGYPINPARDFAPRFFTFLLQGSEAFTRGQYHFWIPLVGPMVGSVVGTLAYAFAIENNWP